VGNPDSSNANDISGGIAVLRVVTDPKPMTTSNGKRPGRPSRFSLWSLRAMKRLFGSNLGPSWYHKLMKRVLRSALHPVASGNTALLSFSGRKTGKRYTIPVSYVAENGMFLLMTKFKWWRNLRGGARVNLTIKGRELEGVAETVEDPEAIREGMREFLTRVPRDARFYEVEFDQDRQPRAADLAQASSSTILIRVEVAESQSGEPASDQDPNLE
jgi:hypothetical protein